MVDDRLVEFVSTGSDLYESVPRNGIDPEGAIGRGVFVDENCSFRHQFILVPFEQSFQFGAEGLVVLRSND